MKSTASVVTYLIFEFFIPACYHVILIRRPLYVCILNSALCMKMHYIKHKASQFYWGRPPNTTMRPRRVVGVDGHVYGHLWVPGGGASLRPLGGLQLSSAGTAYAGRTQK